MNRNNNIAIYGQYKTGTTGLFYKIMNSLSRKPRTLFEKNEYVPIPEDVNSNVLAKVILDSSGRVKYDSFADFAKRIYVIRDPRDWVVSGTLFHIQQNPDCYTNPKRLNNILTLLREKESDPRSVSIVQLLQVIMGDKDVNGFNSLTRWLPREQKWLLKFESQLADALIVRYEDFIDDKLSSLAEYLSLPLAGHADVPEQFNHVTRTKNHGSWRHWFLEEDVDFFKPMIERYIERHHYAPDWDLIDQPSIQPEHSSLYVARTVRKRIDGLTCYNPEINQITDPTKWRKE